MIPSIHVSVNSGLLYLCHSLCDISSFTFLIAKHFDFIVNLTLSSLLGYLICPSGLFLPFMHRTLVRPVLISKRVNYFTN